MPLRRTPEIRGSVRAAATAIVEQLPHAQHGRQAASAQVGQRRIPREHGIFIGKLCPAVSKFFTVENIQSFKNAGEKEILVRRS